MKTKSNAVKPTAKESTAKSNGFVSGYRDGSNYDACARSLYSLGLGKFHAADTAIKAVLKIMGKETDEKKALCNLQVICRTADFGRPLLKNSFIAKKERNDKGLFFGLFKFSGSMPAKAAWMKAEKSQPEETDSQEIEVNPRGAEQSAPFSFYYRSNPCQEF